MGRTKVGKFSIKDYAFVDVQQAAGIVAHASDIMRD